MIATLCASLLLIWVSYERAQRVINLSKVAAEDAIVDPNSPTGYAGNKQWLVIPEHDNRSYQWIAETEQMLARHEWRVRRIDYENAPIGREVHSASPYRWWLGLLAWCDRTISGRSPGLSVEHATLFAEPLLQVLLLVSGSLFVMRNFGAMPAVLFSWGFAVLFPLAGAYLPGVPDDFGLMQACALWSTLPLLTVFSGNGSITSPGTAQPMSNSSLPESRSRRCLLIAGIAGGCGLWLDAADQLPIIVGLALGAILATWVATGKKATGPTGSREPLPWRLWALAGATTSFVAYLVEYFPANLDMRPQVNHPVYALAWLGMGELLVWITSWIRSGKPFGSYRDAIRFVLAVAAIAALPVALSKSDYQAVVAWDMVSSKLTNLPDGTTAENVWGWIAREGFTSASAAIGLSVLLIVPCVWLLVRRTTATGQRMAMAMVAGPLLVTMTLAVFRLRWWNTVDVMVLLLLIVATAVFTPRKQWQWLGCAGVALGFGLVPLWPAAATAGANGFKFTRAEVEGLYERALAHWISDHAGLDGKTVLVPPYRTPSFCFYGGLRGLGSPNWENRDGLRATFRIVDSTRPDETEALVNERALNYIVIPSWDSDLQNLARTGLAHPEGSFIYALDHWLLFNWLQALPYKLPAIGGFEESSVKIFQVTDEADPATHRSRLIEYFLEMQQMDLAVRSSQFLTKYPANLGALVTLAQVQKASGESEAFTKTFDALLANLSGGSDQNLPWDRRVSLSVALALGGKMDLARAQVQRCLKEINAARIRSLTTGSLYRLQVLGKAYGLTIADPTLRDLAQNLLPAELRERLR
ncbi:MAG TPA: hypothetical protein VGM64_17190 [Lacunisphaera sp.]|jgi:hypothetical protein